MIKKVIIAVMVLILFCSGVTSAARNYYVDNSGNVHATSFTGDGSNLTNISSIIADATINGTTDQNGVQLRFTENSTNNGLTISNDFGREQLVFKLTSHIGNQIVIGPDVDQDFDHAATIDPVLYINSKEEPDTYNTRWMSLYHKGYLEGGYITTGMGSLHLAPHTSYNVVIDKVNVQFKASSTSTDNNSGFGFCNSNDQPGGSLHPQYGRDQLVFELADYTGNQLVICHDSTEDYGHTQTANPTLFIHSNTDADSDNTQWLSLAHDQTDARLTTGDGNLILDTTGTDDKIKMDAFLNLGQDTLTIEDADPNSAAQTDANITIPTSSMLSIACNDSDGCNCILSEIDAEAGDILIIHCAGSNPLYFASVADVQWQGHPVAIGLGQNDTAGFIYTGSMWVQIFTTDNFPP